MENIDKKNETSSSSALFEKNSNPKKSIVFTVSRKSEFLNKKFKVEFLNKKFKVTTKSSYKKNETPRFITRGYWAKSDHIKFIEALYLYDCDWKKIQKYIKNRKYGQVRSHAQKFYLKLKTFKDEELGLDFTTPNVKNLNDIIKIIQQKELISENCGKLLYIISEKLSFGKNPPKNAIIKKENALNNCECQNVNNIINYNYNYNINYNYNFQNNFQELLMYTNIINQQFMNSLINENLLTKINCVNFYNNIVTSKKE